MNMEFHLSSYLGGILAGYLINIIMNVKKKNSFQERYQKRLKETPLTRSEKARYLEVIKCLEEQAKRLTKI